MKKLLALLILGCALLLIFGCSQSPTTPEDSLSSFVGSMIQRPDFIDSRPQADIQKAVLTSSVQYLDKKPTPDPPPDTGADPNPNPAHKYVYIVGISDYEGTANDLQYADDDAVAMRSYFQSQGFTVRMDLDRNATADAITAGLQWLIDEAVPGDEIAFSYSGHGAKAPTYGSSIISTDLYYVTHGYVMQYFNAVDCSKKLATLDCCVAGDFHLDVVSGTVMATASANSSSYDAPDLEQGAWTYFFLEGAEDMGKDYAEDAAEYAEDGMAAWAKPYHLKVTAKHTDKYDGMFDM